ncbi:hypothetical protein PC116_g26551 [Phytophthora cactorum]|uniref:Uncharacterized protein n=1 Tax=Phytophthora cactorum TaxID=29920 RepID=A0A8T1JMR2_9STRA|nr:hypothetical protein PC114_g24826 [Phytophthora cactorum]KAG2889660.1 hypothetical protein PC117_g24637 [Phytophthora cactorum]KAG2967674.1 hypothetical protein PC119_g24413 [Phytophthora cactorum]KAG2984746.1 hypothetical protein PC120_g24183 [Phytophthora cactorum]KAG3127469.1 hypothetical protein C6341_g24973 [Phytophthora cactorum]
MLQTNAVAAASAVNSAVRIMCSSETNSSTLSVVGDFDFPVKCTTGGPESGV